MRTRSSSVKILHIINDLSVGGAEMMLYRLLSEMDKERFNCAVISLKNSNGLRAQIEGLGVPVYTLGIDQSFPSPALIWRLLYLLRRIKPDIIQGWLPHSNLAALAAGVFAPAEVPILWNIQQSLNSLAYEKPGTVKAIKLSARLSHQPAGIIYNSRAGAEEHSAFGYKCDRSIVIYNGVNTTLFSPSTEARRSVRSELGLAEDAVLIGLIGRYHAIKNHSNFIHAAALLKREYPGAQFVLAGSNVCHDNKPLRELILESGLIEQVHLLGERQDIERITAALDVAVSASHSEGFPNVIAEAMACAVPCVVSDVSDLSWAVKGAGLVVPGNHPASMARALAEVLALSIERRKALGQAARARAMEHFRLDYVVAQYAAFYESVITRKEYKRTKASYRFIFGKLL